MSKIITGGIAAAVAVVAIGGGAALAVASDETSNTSGVGNYPVQTVTSQSNDYPAGDVK